MSAIFKQLIQGSTAEVKTQASKCMGAFAVILTKDQLRNLSNKLITSIKSGSKTEKAIQAECLSLIANAVKSKLSPFVGTILPVLEEEMKKINPSECIDIDNEVSEKCLTAMQSIILECPDQMKATALPLFEWCVKLMQYDPMYTYGTKEDVDMEEEAWDYGEDDE